MTALIDLWLMPARLWLDLVTVTALKLAPVTTVDFCPACQGAVHPAEAQGAKVEARRLNRPSKPVPAGPPAAAPPRALCAHAAKAQSLPARLAESWGVQPQKITFGEMRESSVRGILILQ